MKGNTYSAYLQLDLGSQDGFCSVGLFAPPTSHSFFSNSALRFTSACMSPITGALSFNDSV